MSKCLIGNIPKEIAEEIQITYSYLSDEDLNDEMKDLVLQDRLEESSLSIPFSFVYMFDYEDEEMSTITRQLKSKGINAIFVASTQHNLLWKFNDLIQEVVKEHLTFQAMDKLKNLIQTVMKMPVDENKEQVEMTLMAAFAAFQSKDLNAMNQMIEQLEKIQKKSD